MPETENSDILERHLTSLLASCEHEPQFLGRNFVEAASGLERSQIDTAIVEMANASSAEVNALKQIVRLLARHLQL